VSTPPEPTLLRPLAGLPEIEAGADLAGQLRASAQRGGFELHHGALVVCQKVVSKAEGRVVSLAEITPSDEAKRIGEADDKDPRLVELVLRESVRIVRHARGVMICETRHGFVCANAGIDQSNSPGHDTAILLPLDPDASAAALRRALLAGDEGPLGVVISDTFGRPWREGLVDVALGSAGFAPIDDRRGGVDRAGRELQVTATATADQLAAAAGMLMPKASGVPAVWITGVPIVGDGCIRETLRRPDEDLFR
jgi:coenzyme F420-0:L-glutamate ligase/coenzyme F420-1:gamma-L-glutamate ligase